MRTIKNVFVVMLSLGGMWFCLICVLTIMDMIGVPDWVTTVLFILGIIGIGVYEVNSIIHMIKKIK